MSEKCNAISLQLQYLYNFNCCCRHFLAAILGYDTHAHSAALRYLVSLHIFTSSSSYWLRQWLDFPYVAGQNINFGIAGYKSTKIKLLSKWLFRHLVIPQLLSTWRTFTCLHTNTWFIITKKHNWTGHWYSFLSQISNVQLRNIYITKSGGMEMWLRTAELSYSSRNPAIYRTTQSDETSRQHEHQRLLEWHYECSYVISLLTCSHEVAETSFSLVQIVPGICHGCICNILHILCCAWPRPANQSYQKLSAPRTSLGFSLNLYSAQLPAS